jgi:hypothetical protein
VLSVYTLALRIPSWRRVRGRGGSPAAAGEGCVEDCVEDAVFPPDPRATEDPLSSDDADPPDAGVGSDKVRHGDPTAG